LNLEFTDSKFPSFRSVLTIGHGIFDARNIFASIVIFCAYLASQVRKMQTKA
jgi:hypothetical protein